MRLCCCNKCPVYGVVAFDASSSAKVASYYGPPHKHDPEKGGKIPMTTGVDISSHPVKALLSLECVKRMNPSHERAVVDWLAY